jgi:hypothetical protein
MNGTIAAIILLRSRVNADRDRPTYGDCWLLNAAKHLEDSLGMLPCGCVGCCDCEQHADPYVTHAGRP